LTIEDMNQIVWILVGTPEQKFVFFWHILWMHQTRYWMQWDKAPPWGNTFRVSTGIVYKTKRKKRKTVVVHIPSSGDSVTDDLRREEAEWSEGQADSIAETVTFLEQDHCYKWALSWVRYTI
jgi:hypothetical protein